MCSAIFINQTLARTTDRQGSLAEHGISAKETYLGGTITMPNGKMPGNMPDKIWIDGINSHGLMIALLNYRKELTNESAKSTPKTQIHPGQLIPAVLQSCESVKSAAEFLETTILTTSEPEMYPHYILADKTGACITYENHKIIENPIGILTNAPSFEEQIQNFPDLTTETPKIPWNHTSESRFQRLAWLRTHTPEPRTANDFINLLDAVAVLPGFDPKPGYRTIIRTAMSAKDGTYSCCTEENRMIWTINLGEIGEFSLREQS